MSMCYVCDLCDACGKVSKLKELAGKRPCPSCNAEVADRQATTCPSCGAKLLPPLPDKPGA